MKLIKTYKILLIVTILFSFYPWYYDNYLHEKVYVRFLPNYKNEISFETYDLKTGKVATQGFSKSEYISKVPWYGMLFCNIVVPIFLLTPILFIICFFLIVYLTIKYEKFND